MSSGRPAIRYHHLPTEQANPRSRHLDQLSVTQLLRLMHREDERMLRATHRAIPQLARAVRLVTHALRDGGRLIFVGAGTSGRLGVLEAAECPPTFHTTPALVQAIIAGGRRAMFRSREGAEDDRASARDAVQRRVRPGDVVVGITASGVTPFVDDALRTATRRGAKTVLITGHRRSPIASNLRITLAVGPEVLTGSTRLKTATATKLVLNMLTLGVMVQLGKTFGNRMVDVRPHSRKLRARAVRLVQSLTHRPEREAASALRAARGRVKIAVLMLARGWAPATARAHLTRVHGSLRVALSDSRSRRL